MLPQLLVVVAALALSVGPAVAAQAPAWTSQPREVDFSSDSAGFTFTSTRAGDAHAERLSARFRLAEASLEWSIQPNATSGPFTSRLVVASVLEWHDRDGDGRLGVGDAVARRLVVPDLPNATIETVPRPAEGGRVVHASYPFPGGKPGPLDPLTGRRVFSDAALTLSFHVYGAGVAAGGVGADPLQTPLEIRVEKFPRTQPDTRIGLELQLRSEGPMRVDADRWSGNGSVALHEFAWSEQYTTNGSRRAVAVAAQERPGTAGLQAQDAQSTLLAGYEYGNVLHSVSFGTRPVDVAQSALVETLQDVLGDPRTYLVGAGLALAVVGVTGARKLRGG